MRQHVTRVMVRVLLGAGSLWLVAAPAEAAAGEPAALFSKLGCALCHNPGARYHDKILRSVNRSPEELVRWIRNPEKFVPGTPMPTYASLIDEPTALELARWLKEAKPGAPTHK